MGKLLGSEFRYPKPGPEAELKSQRLSPVLWKLLT